MTYPFEKALKIISHYSYLLGKEISATTPQFLINDIIIAPTTEKEQIIFINQYNKSLNYQEALNISGFDKENVSILLICHDKNNNSFIHYEIDKYLTKMNIEKIY